MKAPAIQKILHFDIILAAEKIKKDLTEQTESRGHNKDDTGVGITRVELASLTLRGQKHASVLVLITYARLTNFELTVSKAALIERQF